MGVSEVGVRKDSAREVHAASVSFHEQSSGQKGVLEGRVGDGDASEVGGAVHVDPFEGGGQEQRPLHAHVDEARAGEVGPLDARALQPGVLHRHCVQLGADPRAVGHLVVGDLRVAQVGAVEDGPRPFRNVLDCDAGHPRAAEVGIGEDGRCEVSLEELRAGEVGALQVRARQLDLRQPRAAQARPSQVGVVQGAAAQVGVVQVGPAHVDAVEGGGEQVVVAQVDAAHVPRYPRRRRACARHKAGALSLRVGEAVVRRRRGRGGGRRRGRWRGRRRRRRRRFWWRMRRGWQLWMRRLWRR
mmetsp:Transcript_38906/g.122688  ORF Transcript_38906/g.122688 Transcript_38906/m.122688 type:complete len:300 (+) Transcript_38906:203-1102(+)